MLKTDEVAWLTELLERNPCDNATSYLVQQIESVFIVRRVVQSYVAEIVGRPVLRKMNGYVDWLWSGWLWRAKLSRQTLDGIRGPIDDA